MNGDTVIDLVEAESPGGGGGWDSVGQSTQPSRRTPGFAATNLNQTH